MRLEVPSLDDALRRSYELIVGSGMDIDSSRGRNREVLGVQIEIENPRARLSRYENRSTLYSALGELLWYLAGSDDINFMTYYAHRYPQFVNADKHGRVLSAYGPRLFNWSGLNQITQVTSLLKHRAGSKQAVIQLFDRNDLLSEQRDVPCTCTIQFLCRNGRLDAIASMRSNDAVRGLPHDVFAFTMLQELIARSLLLELGKYRHWVGSLHVYESDRIIAQSLIDEGWQQTKCASMMPMPDGDPWLQVQQLLSAEKAFRIERRSEAWDKTGSNYWDSLIWLLEMQRHFKEKDIDRARSSWDRRPTRSYDMYVKSRLLKLAGSQVQ